MTGKGNLGQILLKFFKVIGCLVGLFVGGFILMFWAALAWIAYKPLPPLPSQSAHYELKDLGAIPNTYQAQRQTTWLLTKDGSVRAEEGSTLLHRHTVLTASNGAFLEMGSNRKNGLEKDRNKYIFRSAKGVEARFPLRQVEGYQWSPFCDFDFVCLNNAGEAIGATWMATGCASSGGTSSPHGRSFPLYWKPGMARAIDLNTQIDPKSGWYLFKAWDINEQGQILCTGAKTDIRGAEHWQGERRFLLLTPQRKNNHE